MNPAEFLLTLGAILLAGLAIDLLGKKTFLPRVTLLLIFGMIIGHEMLDVIPDFLTERFELISNMALLMIGFLLGGKLTKDTLKKSGKTIVIVSIFAAVTTTLMVTAGLLIAGTALAIAIIIGCIASATAPAATADTVLSSGKETPFTRVLISIVALDDAWALILFSTGIAIVSAITTGNSAEMPLIIAAKDIGGAILLGLLLGFPASLLTGRIKPGQPMLTEALGLVFLCGGLALHFGVSFLIASMVMGAVIANFASHHEYPFDAIEGVEWPFIVVFFILAGASLEFDSLQHIGFTGSIYIVTRIAGKISGSALGGFLAKADAKEKKWLGIALLPQAGAAMGMALAAANHFPEYRQTILSITISTTVFFELIGPLFTRIAVRKASD
ncbi:cation:proton antiporter [Prosthecochloris sp. SCSIO W1101]|uniref:cation:proton antiporter n=1 Tax=Prosthecochloris sp. SCSIO W1101 TaxID=2992242 RepID=UPI00223DC26A|nr:cation:proton antiporter [Prosthecochloris sp. SCSIO W1101]UZJ42270.1 cation:proton antiporter [Prosthecochloris sp. SCSIO W1101]